MIAFWIPFRRLTNGEIICHHTVGGI